MWTSYLFQQPYWLDRALDFVVQFYSKFSESGPTPDETE